MYSFCTCKLCEDSNHTYSRWQSLFIFFLLSELLTQSIRIILSNENNRLDEEKYNSNDFTIIIGVQALVNFCVVACQVYLFAVSPENKIIFGPFDRRRVNLGLAVLFGLVMVICTLLEIAHESMSIQFIQLLADIFGGLELLIFWYSVFLHQARANRLQDLAIIEHQRRIRRVLTGCLFAMTILVMMIMFINNVHHEIDTELREPYHQIEFIYALFEGLFIFKIIDLGIENCSHAFERGITWARNPIHERR
jgi:hypothetical protein